MGRNEQKFKKQVKSFGSAPSEFAHVFKKIYYMFKVLFLGKWSQYDPNDGFYEKIDCYETCGVGLV